MTVLRWDKDGAVLPKELENKLNLGCFKKNTEINAIRYKYEETTRYLTAIQFKFTSGECSPLYETETSKKEISKFIVKRVGKLDKPIWKIEFYCNNKGIFGIRLVIRRKFSTTEKIILEELWC